VRHHSSMSCVLGAAAGDVYEHAVLVALKSQNEDMQEHAFTQLKTFCSTVACYSRHIPSRAQQRFVHTHGLLISQNHSQISQDHSQMHT
jgi:hypothetical protein